MAVKTKRFKALHTTRYVIRNDEVRAIRLTERNFESVLDWCKGKGLASLKNGQIINRRIEVRTPRGRHVARIGDFVAINRNPEKDTLRNGKKGKAFFFVGKDDVFEAQFNEVK